MSRRDIDSFTRSVKGVYNLSSIRPGRTLSIWMNSDRGASISRLTYEIDDTNYLDVNNIHGAFKAQVKKLSKDVRYESAQGRIRNSLYGSAVSDGVNPEVVIKLTDIFAHDVNFFSGVQKGDTYAALFENIT
jgi:hypothetical protein